jgi:transposase
MEGLIAELDLKIDKLTEDNKLKESIELLDTIPGVDEVAAESIVAEIATEREMYE